MYLAITLLDKPRAGAIRLIILIGFFAFGALTCAYAVVKGIVATFTRQSRFEPGILINLSKERGLGHFIAPLCSAIGTRIPDSVILHSEPTFFVTQGKINVFNGVAKGRILALGAPMLGGLMKNELRAIVAHEFAHFSGGDLLYSSVVLPVYIGAATAGRALEESLDNAESFFQKLPMRFPLIILRGFYILFSLVDNHLSRAREERADAIATETCGSESCRFALMKSYGLDVTFYDDDAIKIVNEANTNAQATNYYTAFRKALPRLVGIANAHYQTALQDQGNPYDAHPTLKRRLDAIRSVPEKYNDKESSVTLFANLEEYEEILGKAKDTMATLAARV